MLGVIVLALELHYCGGSGNKSLIILASMSRQLGQLAGQQLAAVMSL